MRKKKKVTSTLKKKKFFYFLFTIFFLVFSLYRPKTNGFAPIQTRIDPDKFWAIKAHSGKPTQRLISLSPIQRSPARFLVVGEGFVKRQKRCVLSSHYETTPSKPNAVVYIVSVSLFSQS